MVTRAEGKNAHLRSHGQKVAFTREIGRSEAICKQRILVSSIWGFVPGQKSYTYQRISFWGCLRVLRVPFYLGVESGSLDRISPPNFVHISIEISEGLKTIRKIGTKRLDHGRKTSFRESEVWGTPEWAEEKGQKKDVKKGQNKEVRGGGVLRVGRAAS